MADAKELPVTFSADVANFDPNLNYCGKRSQKTIRLTFGLWRYRAAFEVAVGGNISGFDNIGCAIGALYDEMFGDNPDKPLVLTDSDGNTLEATDDDAEEDDWLKEMLVAAEIVSIQPQEKAGVV